MNILAVDDEYYALELMRSALEEVAGGATVYLCRDVRSALQTATETRMDVAFLDIHMPEKNGVELARELKLLNPKINIIFATGFSEHMKEGIDLRMSGYITKPVTPEAVKEELENLRNPIEWSNEKRIKILTFGNFEVLVDGTPLKFDRKQSKEILAYLIDKRGTSATYSELAAMLWEDEEYDRTKQKNLQVYIASLVKSLLAVDVKDLLLKNRQGILLNTGIVDCDYYRFLEGDTRAINSFTGQYMSAYSWAEFTVGYLENQIQKLR
ncbi:MAG: response regulator [Ruminococcaceae bacterium]|nr:response regulator [Oscillospiraceae bacterium]